MLHLLLSLFLILSVGCQSSVVPPPVDTRVLPGAYHLDAYLPQIKDKRVGLVVNHTSMIDQTHLADTLLALGVDVKLIFSPEHGFKGTAYNGEKVDDSTYDGILIKSLYGNNKKPSSEDMAMVDILLFDIQDVGARFYTYISTLHYAMEAAAEANRKVIILDRPNPNAHYVDGPVLEEKHASFVGMHPVPIVYGMTIGEYGQMINGEGWMDESVKCNLDVIPVSNYTHQTEYILPTPPSPNLPNQRSIYLYPSLCLFEGTVISAGRGTDLQFQIYGHPKMDSKFSYVPVSMTSSKYPKHEGKETKGRDLSMIEPSLIRNQKKIDLSYLTDAYESTSVNDFFLKNGFFEKLAGTASLKGMIIDKKSNEEIRESWSSGLTAFKEVRSKYLIYED